jgi:hypothetical protein
VHLPGFVARSVLANILAALCLTPAYAETPDGEAFVAAFGEVCIPERLSWTPAITVVFLGAMTSIADHASRLTA